MNGVDEVAVKSIKADAPSGAAHVPLRRDCALGKRCASACTVAGRRRPLRCRSRAGACSAPGGGGPR